MRSPFAAYARLRWVVLVLYAIVLTRDITLPWVGMHDWNGAFYSYASYNIVRYPVSVSRLLPVVEMGRSPPPTDQTVRYATHPPGLAWLLALSFRVAGYAEWSARLVPIVFSLATVWLLMHMIARARDGPAALTCGLIYIMMPMNAFFGRMVNHEPICQFFMLLSWHGWTGIRRSWLAGLSPPIRAYAAWIGGTTGAIWIDWPGILAAGATIVDVLRTKLMAPRTIAIDTTSAGKWRTAMPVVAAFACPTIITLACLLLLVHGGLGGSYAALRDMFFSRSSLPPATVGAARDEERRDISTRGKTRWDYTVENASPGVLGLACVGVVAGTVLRLRRHNAAADSDSREIGRLTAYFVFIGGVWLALFWPQFLKHNYWQFYLGVPIALAATGGVTFLSHFVARWRRSLAPTVGALLLMAAAVPAWTGMRNYFSRRSQPIEFIQAWQSIAATLPPDDEVLVTFNVEAPEQRGAYRYRNLHTPQLAYYLDRRCTLLTDPRAQARGTNAFGIVLARDDPRDGNAAMLDRLRRNFPTYVGRGFVLVDLHPQRGLDWSDFGTRVPAN